MLGPALAMDRDTCENKRDEQAAPGGISPGNCSRADDAHHRKDASRLKILGAQKRRAKPRAHNHPGPVLMTQEGRASWRLSVVEQGRTSSPELLAFPFHVGS